MYSEALKIPDFGLGHFKEDGRKGMCAILGKIVSLGAFGL
jgi:hypothetical protein